MRWGFGWELGPFEIWDSIGVRRSVEKMKSQGKDVPEWVIKMLNKKRESFYNIENGNETYWCPKKESELSLVAKLKEFNISLIKNSGGTIKNDISASLHDIGDGVLNVEFHSILQPRLNPIDGSCIEIINNAIDLINDGNFIGMVLGHQGPNF